MTVNKFTFEDGSEALVVLEAGPNPSWQSEPAVVVKFADGSIMKVWSNRSVDVAPGGEKE